MEELIKQRRIINSSDGRSLLEEVLIKRSIYNIDDIKYIIDTNQSTLGTFAEECYSLMVRYQNDISLDFYIQRLADVYCSQYFNWYDYYDVILKKISKNNLVGSGINSIIRYLNIKRSINAPFAAKPLYMRTAVESSEEELHLPITDSNILTDEQMVNFIFILAEKENLTFECPKNITPQQALLQKLTKINQTKRNNIYAKFMDTVRKDINLFMKYGPVNEYIDENYMIIRNTDKTLNHNTIYGGARMFLDNASNPNNEEDEIQSSKNPQEWFTGYCMVCRKKIKTYKYAVRLPLIITGGWFGCYCSWLCIDEIIDSDPNYESQKELIDKIQTSMHNTGIYE